MICFGPVGVALKLKGDLDSMFRIATDNWAGPCSPHENLRNCVRVALNLKGDLDTFLSSADSNPTVRVALKLKGDLDVDG